MTCSNVTLIQRKQYYLNLVKLEVFLFIFYIFKKVVMDDLSLPITLTDIAGNTFRYLLILHEAYIEILTVLQGTAQHPFFCILEIGKGWAPAVINSPSELILIQKIQKEMNDDHSYWIGGSTYTKHGKPVTFYDYLTTLTG